MFRRIGNLGGEVIHADLTAVFEGYKFTGKTIPGLKFGNSCYSETETIARYPSSALFPPELAPFHFVMSAACRPVT